MTWLSSSGNKADSGFTRGGRLRRFPISKGLKVVAVHRRQLYIASVVALLALQIGCSPKNTSVAEVRRPVKTFVVSSGNELRIRSFPGKVEASQRVELAFQVPGLLVEFPVKEGQRIEKGELIARLRQDEFQARVSALQGRLDQARAALQSQLAGERPEERRRREAQVRAAEARLANARAEFERSSRLLSTRSISQSAHELTETTYRVAQEDLRSAVEVLEKGTIGREEDIQAQKAEVRALEAQLVEAQIHLDDTTLRAPYDGVIAERFAEVRQNVRAKDPVVRFQDVEEIEIVLDVPESVMITDLRRADFVQLVAELSGAPGVEYPVHLREMSQVADPVTQTFSVRVGMQVPADLSVLPGMTAIVTATYRRASILGERRFIPVASVVEPDSEQPAVWIIGTDGTVSRRNVRIGELAGGDIEVLDGLNPGDRIAVAGVRFLREGMQVSDLGDALGGSVP
jgi:membrane fusion protein, multidrug efflux system